MKPKLINPAYAIAINVVNCQIEVKCNGVNVYEYKSKSSAKGNGMSITVPVNHLVLKNGTFNVTAKVLPVHGKEALERTSFARFQILMLDYAAPKETMVKLFEIETPDQATNNSEETPAIDLLGLPFYELIGASLAEALPFELVGWNNSLDLKGLDQQKLLIDAYHFYQEMQTLINNKDIKGFMEQSKDKDELLKTAYFYGFEDVKREKQQLQSIFNEPGLSVLPFKFQDVEMEIMGEKLVRLKRKNGLPVLMLYNPLNKMTVKLDIKLHKKTASSPLSII